jgi:hypothetical protein
VLAMPRSPGLFSFAYYKVGGEGDGGRDWDRTSDPCDVNAVLVPLSYAPAASMAEAFYIGWWQAKATRRLPPCA